MFLTFKQHFYNPKLFKFGKQRYGNVQRFIPKTKVICNIIFPLLCFSQFSIAIKVSQIHKLHIEFETRRFFVKNKYKRQYNEMFCKRDSMCCRFSRKSLEKKMCQLAWYVKTIFIPGLLHTKAQYISQYIYQNSWTFSLMVIVCFAELI